MEPILQFFHYDHLPPHLREVSRPFCDMAHTVVAKLPRNAERTVCLRKLLEAKDAAVRAVILVPDQQGKPVTSDPNGVHTDPLRSARSIEDVIQEQKQKERDDFNDVGKTV